MNQIKYFQYRNDRATSHPYPQCLGCQIQVQESALVAASNQKPNLTLSET